MPAEKRRPRINVLSDVIAAGRLKTPCVVENHVRDRYNEFAVMLDQGSPKERYEAAVKLAGITLRYAWENRIR